MPDKLKQQPKPAMKKLLFILFLLSVLIPGQSQAAVQDIHIDWSYTYVPVEGKTLAGYRLYKEGVQVCDIVDPDAQAMDCQFETEDGTFNFTLTSFFIEGDESPHSPNFPFTFGSTPPPPEPTPSIPPEETVGNTQFTFQHQYNDTTNITGFRFYINSTRICETTDPASPETTFKADMIHEIMAFTMTAVNSDGTESTPSNLLTLNPADYPQLFTTKGTTFTWNFTGEESAITGFRLYQNSTMICETTDPTARELSCETELDDPPVTFTMTAVGTDGTESSLSNGLLYSLTAASPPPPEEELPPPPPVIELKALITSNSTEGEVPFTVSFDSSGSTGTIGTYSWSFGDGDTTDTPSPDHTYTFAGTYTATLTITDAEGQTSSASISITATESVVIPVPPVAVMASSAAAGETPLTVNFSGAGSSATDATISQYIWSFGDSSSGTGETTSHTYMAGGTYSATLTITDSNGLTDSVNTPVIVTEAVVEEPNQAPTAIFDATPTTGPDPLLVAFNASAASDPDGTITTYIWNFGDGNSGSGSTTSHTYTGTADYTATLTVTDDKGATSSSTIGITTGVATEEPTFNIELGEVDIDHNWLRVDFESVFQSPIIVAGPAGSNDAEPCLIRLRNIEPTGFEIRLQEWDYQDGTHQIETISFVVVEAGHHILEDGSNVEAGTFSGTTKFAATSFQGSFVLAPVVLTTVVTFNEADAISGRLQNITLSGFEYYFREQESVRNTHVNETVHYIAWEPGKGTMGTLLYESKATPDSVTHEWHNIAFETPFTDLPLMLAEMQNHGGRDSSNVRLDQLQPSSAQVKVAEEQSKDDEVTHTPEIVGYLVFGSAGTEEQPPQEETPPEEEPATIQLTFTWEYDQAQEATIQGFRIYLNATQLCETSTPSDRQISCESAPLVETTIFTIKAVTIDGEETTVSNSLPYTP